MDAAWQRRVSSGDPALQSVGKGSAEARVNEFLDKAPLMVADNKCAPHTPRHRAASSC